MKNKMYFTYALLFISIAGYANLPTNSNQSQPLAIEKTDASELQERKLTSLSMQSLENVEGTEERIQIGSRISLTEKKENEIAAKEKSESQEEITARALFFTSHNGAYHIPKSITYLGDAVTIEDGSIWSIASYDWWKTQQWLGSDTLLIMQNKFKFSNYQFLIVNQNTGQEVEANLALGPFVNGLYTHWIVGIDYFNKIVYLEDGSTWEMTERNIVNSWIVNDTIIIGVNQEGSFNRPNILINVNTLNFGRGINFSN